MTEPSLVQRTEDACEQFKRYFGHVFGVEFVELLELLTDINDDLWHGRFLSKDHFDEAKNLLDKIAHNQSQQS